MRETSPFNAPGKRWGSGSRPTQSIEPLRCCASSRREMKVMSANCRSAFLHIIAKLSPMTEPTSTTTPAPRRSFWGLLRELRQPKVAVMLALGFSSGLPFLLTANTFGYWLRDEGTSLTAIGFISWVGFMYAFKVYWSPLVDRVDVPLLGRLGRRRGWMLFCQL